MSDACAHLHFELSYSQNSDRLRDNYSKELGADITYVGVNSGKAPSHRFNLSGQISAPCVNGRFAPIAVIQSQMHAASFAVVCDRGNTPKEDVAGMMKLSERAQPETEFRRYVQNFGGQVRSSG